MRRVLATSMLVGAGLFVTACSDQHSPLPTEPPISPTLTARSCTSPLQLAALTLALFAPGDLLTFARSTQNNINLKMSRGDIAGARKLALAFVDFTLKTYYQGKLRDPNGANPPTTAEAVVTLIDGILCWVGLPPSGLQLVTTGAGVTVTTKLIGPGGDQFKSTDELSGLKVPPGAVSEDRLWVITRRDDLATAGTCVSTTLRSQIPLCIDFSVVPAQDVAKPLVVAICQPEDNHPVDRRLAHKLPEGKVELLAATADPFPLVCTSTPDLPPPGLGRVGRAVWKVGSVIAQVLGPKRLHATHSGLGGLLGPKLSPVAAVQVRLTFDVQPSNTEPSSPITPAVQVAFRDVATGAIANEVTNRIKVGIGTNPGEATLGGDTIQPPSNGIATFANLTIGNSATGYTLVADALSSSFTGDSLIHTPATSNAFDITTTLVDCPGTPGGDQLDRGFYVPQFPGTRMDNVTLHFSANTAGTYTFSLTARTGTYDGAVLGTATATATLTADILANVATTFRFSPTAVTEGSTVTFAIGELSGPAGGVVFYSVPVNDPACPVVQTNGTTPPLDSNRRQGVHVKIEGGAPIGL